jgi:hypothetical protein
LNADFTVTALTTNTDTTSPDLTTHKLEILNYNQLYKDDNNVLEVTFKPSADAASVEIKFVDANFAPRGGPTTTIFCYTYLVGG